MKDSSRFSFLFFFFSFFFWISFSFSFLFSPTLVSGSEIELFVSNSTALENALSILASNPINNNSSNTVITVTQSFTISQTFTCNTSFTLRSTPGQVFTLTFNPSVEMDFTGNTLATTYNVTLKDLILTRPNSDDIYLMKATSTSFANSRSLTFINVVFINAAASNYLIFLTNFQGVFKNCKFESNGDIGVMNLVDSPTVIAGCVFSNNPMPIFASVQTNYYRIEIDNSSFVNNWSYFQGGVISAASAALRVSNSHFYNNIGDLGGAIYALAYKFPSQSAIEIISCKFDNNTAFTVS